MPTITETFDLLTKPYQPRVMADQIFSGTPVLNKLRQNTVRVTGGRWEPILEVATDDGEWYTRNSQVANLTTPSGDIAAKAQFTFSFYRNKVYIPAQDVKLNTGEDRINLLQAYIKNAQRRTSENITTALFTTVANAISSLLLACSDATWGGINPATAGNEYWKAHIMEGASDGTHDYGIPVSPSLANLRKIRRSIVNTTGEKPDLIVVDEDYWDVLMAQFDPNDFLMAQQSKRVGEVLNWGFDAFGIVDTPVISDRAMVGNDWVAGQDTRSAAAGHDALFLNFNHLKMGVVPGLTFAWSENGWVIPNDYHGYLNFFYVWCMLGTDVRRVLGRLCNVDITQDPSDWQLGEVNLPGA